MDRCQGRNLLHTSSHHDQRRRMGRYRLVQNRQIISPDFLQKIKKHARVFRKTCRRFRKNMGMFFSYIRHVLFAHWKILSLIRTFFPSSAQYTFSANRKTSIFCSLAQHTFFTHRYNTLLLPIARHIFFARQHSIYFSLIRTVHFFYQSQDIYFLFTSTAAHLFRQQAQYKKGPEISRLPNPYMQKYKILFL